MEDFRNNDGLGVQGIVDGHAVLVGRSQLSREWSVTLTDDLQRANKDTEQKAAPLGRVVDLRAATRRFAFTDAHLTTGRPDLSWIAIVVVFAAGQPGIHSTSEGVSNAFRCRAETPDRAMSALAEHRLPVRTFDDQQSGRVSGPCSSSSSSSNPSDTPPTW